MRCILVIRWLSEKIIMSIFRVEKLPQQAVFLLGLLFYPEHGDCMVIWNVSNDLPLYTTSYPLGL
jgi:hypothetical protein